MTINNLNVVGNYFNIRLSQPSLDDNKHSKGIYLILKLHELWQ